MTTPPSSSGNTTAGAAFFCFALASKPGTQRRYAGLFGGSLGVPQGVSGKCGERLAAVASAIRKSRPAISRVAKDVLLKTEFLNA